MNYEKWENSLEGVLYNLRVWGASTNEDERNTKFIAQALLRLPKNIRRKVLDEVVFVHTTAQGVMMRESFPKSVDKKGLKKLGDDNYVFSVEQPLIILNFRGVKGSEKMDIIAHEIAHYVLGHGDIKGSLPKNAKENINEKKADDLSEKWGFKHSYKSYNLYSKK